MRHEGAGCCGFLNEKLKAETVLQGLMFSQLRGRRGDLHIGCVGCIVL